MADAKEPEKNCGVPEGSAAPNAAKLELWKAKGLLAGSGAVENGWSGIPRMLGLGQEPRQSAPPYDVFSQNVRAKRQSGTLTPRLRTTKIQKIKGFRPSSPGS